MEPKPQLRKLCESCVSKIAKAVTELTNTEFPDGGGAMQVVNFKDEKSGKTFTLSMTLHNSYQDHDSKKCH